MNLVNREVVHETFGKGNVVNYDESYIRIHFKSGNKRFVFPDVFKKHIEFIDQRATNIVKEKMAIKEEERRKEELILQKEKALEEERQRVLEEQKRRANCKVHPKIQSVFWCKAGEDIFEEWKVFTGEIKSGKKKGQPRRLARMTGNSACLITKRESDIPEKDRRILGFYLTKEFFDGRECEDGYIKAHPKYRLRLSEKESEKMLFWNYYYDNKSPKETTWNSGRQRYFDNIWMAQILRDIVSLRDGLDEKKDAESFFRHFCEINQIDIQELPEPNGALNQEA